MRQVRASGNLATKALMEDDRFRSLFENSADAQFLLEGDIFVDCNSAALKMMGCGQKADILGHHPNEFSPPMQPDGQMSLDKARDMLATAMAKGSHRFEWVHRRADGTDFPSEVLLTPLRTNGKLLLYGVVRDVTERNHAQQALRESEARFKQLFESVNDGIALRDAWTFELLDANRRFCQMYGYTLDELKALPSGSLGIQGSPDERREQVMTHFQQVANGLPILVQWHARRKDGSAFWAELNGTRITIGTRECLLLVVRDITERKRAEETLTRERNRAQTYLDLAGVMLVAIETDQTVSLINKKGCEVLECEEKEIVGTNWFDTFVPERQREQVKGAFALLLAGEIEPIEYLENAVVTKNGHEKIIAWHNTVLRDHGGEIICTLSSGEDITERRKTEQRLRESEERYRTAIEHSNDGVAIVKEGRHVYVSPRFLEMFGYDGPEEILDKSVADARHVHPEDRARLVDTNRRRLKGEPASSRYDHRAVHKDGRILHVEISATTVAYEGERAALVYLRGITERRQAELRLRDSEEAMKSLLNATNDIACLMDIGGAIIAANAILAQRLGREVGALIGQNLFDLFPKEVARSRRLCAQKVVETGKPVRVEDTSSNNRYYDSCVYPVFDQDGKVVRLAVYAKDITEAKQAGRALAESEARFKQLFDNVSDGIAVRDAKTFELLDANRRYCEMHGYTLEELKALPLGGIGAHESVEERRKRLIAHYGRVTKGVPSLVEWEARRKDGSAFWVELNGTMITIGNRECLLSVVRDVTERKRTEQTLRESEERYRTAIEHSNDGVTITQEGKHVYVNHKFLEMFGYSYPEEVLNKSIADASHMHPDDRQRIAEWNRRRLRGETAPSRYEHKAIHKDGRTIYLELSSARIMYQGKAASLSYIRDITERRNAEEALRWKTTFLEALVDSSHDGILVLDDRMQKVLQNDRLVQMFKMPQDIAETEDETQRIEFLMRSIKDPREFYGKLMHLYNHSNEIIHSEFELKDGTVVDTFSYPVIGRHAGEQYGRIWMFRDITEVRRYWDMLEGLSTTDGLTETSNRRRFDEFLKREWLRSMREQTELSLILVDIDHFKQFNDRYGHLAGDNCLKQVAAALGRAGQRAGDLVARYGGDEFACVLPGTGLKGADSLAQRIADEVARLRIPHEGSAVADYVTLSIGLATIVPERGQERSDLVTMADRSLYSAKQRGRNRIAALPGDNDSEGEKR